MELYLLEIITKTRFSGIKQTSKNIHTLFLRIFNMKPIHIVTNILKTPTRLNLPCFPDSTLHPQHKLLYYYTDHYHIWTRDKRFVVSKKETTELWQDLPAKLYGFIMHTSHDPTAQNLDRSAGKIGPEKPAVYWKTHYFRQTPCRVLSLSEIVRY